MADTSSPRPWRWRIPYRFLSLLVSVVLVAAGFAIMNHRIDWRDIAALWTNLDPALVAAAVALYWLQYPTNSYRLQRVVLWSTSRPSAKTPSLGFLLKVTCGSAFVAVAAPIGLAADAAKIAALRMFGSLSITEAARCALFDRVVGVQFMALCGLAGLPFQIAAGVERSIVLAQLALFAGIIAAVGVLLVLPRAFALVRYALVTRIAAVFAGYAAFITGRRLAIQLVIAMTNVLLSWASLYLLVRAAGLTSNVWLVGGFIPLLQLVNGLPFLYMGWGGREIVMAATLGAAGSLTVNETLAVSIAWGVIMVLTSAVNGVFLLGNWQIAPAGLRATSAGRPAAPADARVSPPADQHTS